MSTTFYIKKNDTAEELKFVMKKRQAAVDGVVPPDTLWYKDKPIGNVYFSMKKIPILQDDGDYLYPDGTLHKPDGTIVNPLGNPDIYISGIVVHPGETLNEDYSVTEEDGDIRYPTGLVLTTAGNILIPNGSILLPNGMILLPANNPYPQGYTYNPGDIDRTNYYKVGNPTENEPNSDGTIDLPDDTYLDTLNYLCMPKKVLDIPEGSAILSTTTIKLPTGTTKETSPTINRNNAIVLPRVTVYHPVIYSITYSSTTHAYQFPSGTTLVKDDEAKTAYILFPNSATMVVPYTTFEYSVANFIFPYGSEYVSALRKFIFPGEIWTLPLDATINVFGLEVSVTFPIGTVIDSTEQTITLINENYLHSNGNAILYDGSKIIINYNYIQLYNDFIFYPRGTQKNSLGTIIHPDGSVAEGSYLRYYPVLEHPTGLLIRVDGSIVNPDGTFTKLDNSIVDANGQVIQVAHTEFDYYSSTTTPPYIPVSTETQYIVINHKTGSYEDVVYIVTGSQTASATVLKYQWSGSDTSHEGNFSAEFEIHYSDLTIRTFPILSGDQLLISVLSHFQ